MIVCPLTDKVGAEEIEEGVIEVKVKEEVVTDTYEGKTTLIQPPTGTGSVGMIKKK